MRVSFCVFAWCTESLSLWNKIHLEKWGRGLVGGGGASLCVCMGGAQGPFHSLVSLSSAHTRSDGASHGCQLEIWEEKKTKWRFLGGGGGGGSGGKFFQGQSTKGCNLARQKKKRKKGRERSRAERHK